MSLGVSGMNGILALQTVLAVLNEDNCMAQFLALYFVGPAQRGLLTGSFHTCPRVVVLSVFYKGVLAFFRPLQVIRAKLGPRKIPAAHHVEEFNTDFIPRH